MRDFSSVSPQFWIGSTGKSIRGDSNTQVLALYLLTCPHANMIGVFHCPMMYMAHETGMSLDSVQVSLDRLVSVGFCIYDEETECVFVVNMVVFQVGDNLKIEDNKVKGVKKYVEKIASKMLKEEFLLRYSEAFHIPLEAPFKPLQRVENTLAKQLTGTGSGTGSIDQKKSARKVPIPDDFSISDSVYSWATENGFSNLDKHLSHFVDVSKAKGYKYADWDAAFRNAIKGNWAKVETVSNDDIFAGAL